MQWNKKSASILAGLALILGGAGAVGLQVHAAQQNTAQIPPSKIQIQSTTTGEQENTATDTDNIQNGKDNGAPESAVGQENAKEKSDGIETSENLPGGGHQDQTGANVDHQSNGIE